MLRESARGVEMLIRMERTKSWSRGARSQYAKVDALQCCEFCNRFVKKHEPCNALVAGHALALRDVPTWCRARNVIPQVALAPAWSSPEVLVADVLRHIEWTARVG